jgi:hypothetical protein
MTLQKFNGTGYRVFSWDRTTWADHEPTYADEYMLGEEYGVN